LQRVAENIMHLRKNSSPGTWSRVLYVQAAARGEQIVGLPAAMRHPAGSLSTPPAVGSVTQRMWGDLGRRDNMSSWNDTRMISREPLTNSKRQDGAPCRPTWVVSIWIWLFPTNTPFLLLRFTNILCPVSLTRTYSTGHQLWHRTLCICTARTHVCTVGCNDFDLFFENPNR
jgi:hypothetical protein